MVERPGRTTPTWAWLVIALVLAGGALVSLVVLLLGLYTLSAPACSTVTSRGRAAHRLAGIVIVLGLAGTWATALLGVTRATGTRLRIAVAALPLVLAPLLITATSATLDARMDAIGDDGGSSCF